MSIRPQASAPFLSEEVAERLLALPTPPPSPLSPYSSPLPQIPSPPLPIPSPPPISPTYTEMPEICLPLRKRPCRTTPGPGYEVGESSAAGTARQVGPTTARADLYGFADMLDAAPGCQTSRDVMTELYLEPESTCCTDRPFHRRTAILMGEEARLSRAAWAQSMDACESCIFLGHITSDNGHVLSQSEITDCSSRHRRQAGDYRSAESIPSGDRESNGDTKDHEEPQNQISSFRDSRDLLRILQSQSYQRRPVAVLRLEL
ncbi:hypothetical protein Tco_0486905 [Tanacetum coccineum]